MCSSVATYDTACNNLLKKYYVPVMRTVIRLRKQYG